MMMVISLKQAGARRECQASFQLIGGNLKIILLIGVACRLQQGKEQLQVEI